ncbi:hypothetical protein PFISCL1PPCAC_23498, partial [Pristionchus fissidentatus]
FPNQMMPQPSPSLYPNSTAGGSCNSATMNNGENNIQRPAIPAFPYGFIPNQMTPKPSPISLANHATCGASNSSTVNNGNNTQQPRLPAFPYGLFPNQMMPQPSPSLHANNTAGGPVINNGENNTQSPGLPAFPYGFTPNQMMPQSFPSFQAIQTMGDPFSGAFPQLTMPQMMPNMPMFNMNGFPQMPGMASQMFNPMQFAPPGMNPFLPAGQSIMPMGMTSPMGYVMYGMMPMNGQQMMMSPHAPIPVHIKDEPCEEGVQCTAAVTRRSIERKNNSFAIDDILGESKMKEEVVDEQVNSMSHSIITKASDSTDSSSNALGIPLQPEPYLNPQFVYQDIPDTPASPEYHYEDGNDLSPQMIPEDSVPSSSSPSAMNSFGYDDMSREEVEEDKTQDTIGVDSAQSPPPYDYNPGSPTHSPWRELSTEKSSLASFSSTPDRLRIVESQENVFGEEEDNVLEEHEELHLEESIDDLPATPLGSTVSEAAEDTVAEVKEDTVAGGREYTVAEAMADTIAARIKTEIASPMEAVIDAFLAELNGAEEMAPALPPMRDTTLKRPVIPPRFPKERDGMREMDERRAEMEKKCSRRSPIAYAKEEDTRSRSSEKDHSSRSSSSPDRKNKDTQHYTVLIKDVPERVERPRIRRYFEDKYDCHCEVRRVDGQPRSTIRIEFPWKITRDRVLRESPHSVSRTNLFAFEEVLPDEADDGMERKNSVEEKRHFEMVKREKRKECEESKEEIKEPKSHSPIRIPSGRDVVRMKMDEHPPELPTFFGKCGKMTDIILTAGPIPSECSVASVVEYFRSMCTEVLYLPYPSQRSREFLVLQFNNIDMAMRVLESSQHHVDGHAIHVYPPYDVHVKMLNMNSPGRVESMIEMLQNECGPIAKIPNIITKSETYKFGYISFARPQDAHSAIAMKRHIVMDGKCEIIESTSNYSYQMFKDAWIMKCMRVKMEEQRANRDETRRRRRRILGEQITSSEPIITVGPIPDHLLEECDEYLLKNFDAVHNVPYPTKYDNYRLLIVNDPAMIRGLFHEGYIRVGKKQEKILISPPFDVVFGKGPHKRIHAVVTEQLILSMQKKYGPIVRPVIPRKGVHIVTFGRLQDGQRAIEDSPHFKKLQVVAEEKTTNSSFIPFANLIDLELFYSRVRETEMMKEAANIRINYRPDPEADQQADTDRRRRRHSDEEEEKVGVLMCSPVSKRPRTTKEGNNIVVRVSDSELWLPKRAVITDHFSKYGKIKSFIPVDHNQAFIEFGDRIDMLNALERQSIQIGGLWLDVSQCND